RRQEDSSPGSRPAPISADSRIPPPHLHIPATAGFLPGEILLSARWGGVRWGGGGVGRSGVAGGSGCAVAARTVGLLRGGRERQAAAGAAARGLREVAGGLEVRAEVLRQRERDVLRRRADLLDLAVAEAAEVGDDVADEDLGHRGAGGEAHG